MSYVIIKDSDKNIKHKLVMIDRNLDRTKWWTMDITKAFVFIHKEAAEAKCKLLKFDNPIVLTLVKATEVLKRTLQSIEDMNKPRPERESWFSGALREHGQIWHDDDWDEGVGGSVGG